VQLQQHVNHNVRMICIVGRPGMGKTTLMSQACDAIEHRKWGKFDSIMYHTCTRVSFEIIVSPLLPCSSFHSESPSRTPKKIVILSFLSHHFLLHLRIPDLCLERSTNLRAVWFEATRQKNFDCFGAMRTPFIANAHYFSRKCRQVTQFHSRFGNCPQELA